MPANPYASQLQNDDALEIISETPRRLAAIAERIGGEGLERRPAPGKWSPRDVLCHLADTELAFAFRLRQALAEPRHTIQPFDQDAWAKPYSELAASDALETFSAVRRWNLALLRAVPKEQFSKKLTHPERGEMEFRVLVETMAGHDRNHLKQLEAM